MDSGASISLTPHESELTNIRPARGALLTAEGATSMEITGIGTKTYACTTADGQAIMIKDKGAQGACAAHCGGGPGPGPIIRVAI